MSTRQEPPPYQDNQTAFIQPQAQNAFIPPSKTVNSLDVAGSGLKQAGEI